MKEDNEQKIKQAIAEVAALADKMPGVVTLHNLQSGTLAWMSPTGLRGLGVAAEEVIDKSHEEYHGRFFNPEDAKDYVPKILGLIERNNSEEMVTYFQQIKTIENDDWSWFMGSIRIFSWDHENKPLLAIAISIPVDAMHHMAAKAERLLEENNFLRSHHQVYATLTNRERDVLRLLALGKSSAETAEELFIAQTTVETHRKNIKQKLKTNSYYDLCQFARAFDLI